MPACPTRDQLQRYFDGLLDAPSSEQLRAHLESCQTCRSSVEQLSEPTPGGNEQDTEAEATIERQIGASPINTDVDATIAAPLPRTSRPFDALDARTAHDDPDATLETRPTPVDPDATREAPADLDATLDAGSLAGGAAPGQDPGIQGYDIKGILGRGGMGIVYRAVQKNLNRTVALKVLPSAFAGTNPNAVARFRREASAAARLHHTNIIPVYDSGEVPHAYYYAMELIEGEPLDELIRRKSETLALPSTRSMTFRRSIARSAASTDTTTIDDATTTDSSGESSGRTQGRIDRAYFREVAGWIADAASALDYAHREGVIHRDIKPANLILSRDGRIMIADFGLAKTVEEHSVTVAGSFLGTLRYASPEQAKGQDVDGRSDIYALGATMYELLCFQPALPGLTQKELLNAILHKEPERPRRIVANVPPELEVICLKAMEKSRDTRYATAGDLARDLRRYLDDIPIVAKRPNIIQRAVKFTRRNKAVVTAVTAIVVVTASTILTLQAQQARRASDLKSRYESGMFYASNQKWTQAEDDFKAALAIDPNNLATLLASAWMGIERFKHDAPYATQENLEALDKLCQRILAIDPDQTTALSYRSIVLKNLNRYEEAIKATERVIELQPDYYPAWSNLGAYYALIGQQQKAIEKLQRGAKLAQQSGGGRAVELAQVWRNLAAVALFAEKPEAFDYLDRAIQAKRDDIPAWLLRVRARLTLDGYIDVEEALDDAKHVDRFALEQNAKVKRLRAVAHLANNQYEQAATHANAALSLGDVAAYDHFLMAKAYAGTGNLDAARQHLTLGEQQFPIEFSEKPYVVTFDEGVLWFESAQELNRLRASAVSALETATQ